MRMLLYMGFETDECLQFKPYGIANVQALGYRCVVVRDCTATYESAETLAGSGFAPVKASWAHRSRPWPLWPLYVDRRSGTMARGDGRECARAGRAPRHTTQRHTGAQRATGPGRGVRLDGERAGAPVVREAPTRKPQKCQTSPMALRATTAACKWAWPAAGAGMYTANFRVPPSAADKQ